MTEPGDQQRANEALRERSGNIEYDDRLVYFLYELLRTHVLPSDMEYILLNVLAPVPATTRYSNGWLAQHAADIAQRLRA